jgi:hypothetical protein
METYLMQKNNRLNDTNMVVLIHIFVMMTMSLQPMKYLGLNETEMSNILIDKNTTLVDTINGNALTLYNILA